ncbi:hypothetical protein EI427_06280 [Flammeovirga pectinis]|uniref:Circularly permuted type 2 ATP-grasp protein n=1 Tax=Flammeovirga pectinis TaxID=2494373 RepID=A0A3Q9FKL2_9BACT|nr:hypothetical protein [Flammeovirga pectinis]AZQ61858.1 hypothetical protein EI427_06280 [Flammeovirga pectinis]
MIKSLRGEFNKNFSDDKYKSLTKYFDDKFGEELAFRMAETPIFFPPEFIERVKEACDDVVKVLKRKDFKKITEEAIPKDCIVPNEDDHTNFLAVDFAVCKNEKGELEPQMIELQGFPSIFAFNIFKQEAYKKIYNLDDTLTPFFDNSEQEYIEKLKNVILNGHAPENVILLEIFPDKQHTRVDFAATKEVVGIETVCITDVIKEGKDLFYINNGKKTPIKRIYNRLIFDEIENWEPLDLQFRLTDDVNVEWAGHPNWFFRISKSLMPYLESKFVPETKFLTDYTTYPKDLENYVLKPLYSFAGAGVVFHLEQKHLDAIAEEERGNYILQRKINYEPIVEAADGGDVKVEVRLMFIWADNEESPELIVNLCRMSRGEMIGVKYNHNKTFVGASIGLM